MDAAAISAGLDKKGKVKLQDACFAISGEKDGARLGMNVNLDDYYTPVSVPVPRLLWWRCPSYTFRH